MVIPGNQQAYSVAQGTSKIAAFVFQPKDPTINDIKYDLYTGWVNTITKAIWYLEAFLSSGGLVTAQWRAVGPIVVATVAPTPSDYLYPIGQTWIDTAGMNYWGLVNVTGTTATWENLNSGAAAGILTITGNTGGSITGDGSRNVNLIGSEGVVVIGDPATHTLTVTLSGGSQAIDSVEVDAHTGPGTDPVLPDAAGLITVTGGQIAAASTANVIQTNSLAANTYTVQVQRSKAEAASTIGSNGVAHFNSSDFTVDGNGFVSFIGGGTSFTSINIQTFVNSGTYTPTSGMKYCIVEIVGGGGGGGGGLADNVDSSLGGGGGGGAYTRGLFDAASIGAFQSVTIGSGGAGGTTTGTTGGTTSLGSILSVAGGVGGSGISSSSTGGQATVLGGAGGAVITSGSFSISGGSGGSGFIKSINQGDLFLITGTGGSSFFSPQSVAIIALNYPSGTGSNGNSGVNYGGGGSGGGSSNIDGSTSFVGGDGAKGLCVITEYI